MRVIDKEMVWVCAVVAVIGALGIVAFGLVFLGKTIEMCNTTVLAATYCSLCGVLWGLLLIFNLGK